MSNGAVVEFLQQLKLKHGYTDKVLSELLSIPLEVISDSRRMKASDRIKVAKFKEILSY